MINLEKIKKAKGFSYNFKSTPVVDGTFVKTLRNRLNMSQSLFALLLNVTKKTVEKWEQGKNPVSNGNKIAILLFAQHPELVKDFIEISIPEAKENDDVFEQEFCCSFEETKETKRKAYNNQLNLMPLLN